MSSQKEYLRLFYAVEIPEFIRHNIVECIARYKELPDNLKWTSFGNLHLTLRFLGSVEFEKVADLKEILTRVSHKEKPFIYSLQGIGCFPNTKRARVIWIGALKGVDSLKRIACSIEDNLVNYGFEKEEREFTPHVTISRLKDRTRKLTQPFQKYLQEDSDKFFGEFTLKNISLIKSVLTPDGPVYTTLFKSILG